MNLDDFELQIHPADRTQFNEARVMALAERTPFLIEYRLQTVSRGLLWVRAQGRPVCGPDGAYAHWLVTITDITERKGLEDRLAFQAFHDNLTGLPNRVLFRDRLGHAIARGGRSGGSLAVLFLDLDNFKIVNDSLGHHMGDELIQAAADRIQSVVRAADTVARIGGDEFVVLLEDLVDTREAIQVADRVLEALASELRLDDQSLNVSASIGIVFSSGGDANADDMIRQADLAMYAAKRHGRSQHALYEPKMGEEAVERLNVETGLRGALQRDELVVYFQPVVDLRTGKISEVEALVRWNHPERGLLPPGAFMDVAEETGLIRAIDLWVLREACRQVRAWQLSCPHHAGLIASVNLSPSQLREATLSEQVAGILNETGLQPHHLKLEITEHAMVADIQQAKQALVRLAALGVRLAVDDFGTGNSALNYLREFPISTLKIDRSFVTGLRQGHGDTEMVQALITLAQSLGLKVTAEGIEGDEYVDLRRFGCDHGQGYHFARPQEAGVLEKLLWQPVFDLDVSGFLAETAAD
jgi:diguanylate cyclase (GGDEF)-like protein